MEPFPAAALNVLDVKPALDLLPHQPTLALSLNNSSSNGSSNDTSPSVLTLPTQPAAASAASGQETVTMSLDEVMQFAQPIVTDYF